MESEVILARTIFNHMFSMCNYKKNSLGVSALEKTVKVPECSIIGFMHQVLLGVVKRTVVNIYRQKKFNFSHEKKVSSFLEGCKLLLRETNRQLRALSTVKS